MLHNVFRYIRMFRTVGLRSSARSWLVVGEVEAVASLNIPNTRISNLSGNDSDEHATLLQESTRLSEEYDTLSAFLRT